MAISQRQFLDFSQVNSTKARSVSLAQILVGAMSLLLVLAQTAPADADRFDAAAKSAKKIEGNKAIAALFWSQNVNCAKAKGDFRQRQCRGVRDTRLAKVLGQSFLVDVGNEAVDVEVKPKTMSAHVTLRACVSCGDEGPIVVGQGAHRVSANSISAASLATDTKVFKKLAQVEHWSKYIGTRLRAQFIVKVSSSSERFKAAGRQGFKVSVVGYRLYDPCEGEVLVSKPSSNAGPVNADACKDMPAVDDGTSKVPKAPVIIHPDRLSVAQIKSSMKGVKASAKKCHKAYGIDGMATFKMVIAGSGKLTKAKQSGDFKGTPTGICLDNAMKLAVFPKSKKKATPITYPLMLR